MTPRYGTPLSPSPKLTLPGTCPLSPGLSGPFSMRHAAISPKPSRFSPVCAQDRFAVHRGRSPMDATRCSQNSRPLPPAYCSFGELQTFPSRLANTHSSHHCNTFAGRCRTVHSGQQYHVLVKSMCSMEEGMSCFYSWVSTYYTHSNLTRRMRDPALLDIFPLPYPARPATLDTVAPAALEADSWPGPNQPTRAPRHCCTHAARRRVQ
jgi:hypothetical protein